MKNENGAGKGAGKKILGSLTKLTVKETGKVVGGRGERRAKR
ncbi:MAG: hypothetical protein ACPGJS_20115 [Flammeovirgaceae bacterium]